MTRATFFVLSLSLAACSANVPDHRYRCASVADCPSGLVCNANGYCYHADTSPDAGAIVDAPAADAPMPDAVVLPDAGPCTGSNCVSLTVTNAFSDMIAGGSFRVGTTTATMPPFGGTTAMLNVSLDAADQLEVAYGSVSTMYDAMPGMSYAVVLGSAPGSDDTVTVRVLPSNFVSGGAMAIGIHVIDMTQGGSAFSLHVRSDIKPLSRTTDASALLLTTGMRDALEVHVLAGTPEQDVLLAAFDATDMPQHGDYYVVLVGHPDAHLAGPHGLRAIPVDPSGSLVGSAPIVYVLNVATEGVIVCDGMIPLGMIPPGTLFGGTSTIAQGIAGVAAGAPTGAGRILSFHGREDCTGTMHQQDATIPWRSTTTPIVGRVLLAVVGALPDMWSTGAGPEAGPDPTSVAQVITYGNGTRDPLSFGSSAGSYPYTAAGPGVTYHSWTVRPTMLSVDFAAPLGGLVFPWSVTASTAAVLVTTDGMLAHTAAYEMGTTFGQPWSLAVTAPTM